MTKVILTVLGEGRQIQLNHHHRTEYVTWLCVPALKMALDAVANCKLKIAVGCIFEQ